MVYRKISRPPNLTIFNHVAGQFSGQATRKCPASPNAQSTSECQAEDTGLNTLSRMCRSADMLGTFLLIRDMLLSWMEQKISPDDPLCRSVCCSLDLSCFVDDPNNTVHDNRLACGLCLYRRWLYFSSHTIPVSAGHLLNRFNVSNHPRSLRKKCFIETGSRHTSCFRTVGTFCSFCNLFRKIKIYIFFNGWFCQIGLYQGP